MPPRLTLWSTCCSIAVRSRPLAPRLPPQPPFAARALALARSFADDVSPAGTPPPPRIDSSALPPSPFNLGQAKQLPPEEPLTAAELEPSSSENALALQQLELMSHGLDPFDATQVGHKFGIPETPWEEHTHLKDRYDPVLTQLTRLLMRDGKLSKAQRDMALILQYLRTSPPPKINPARPLLPGSPPPSHLPLNPILYLTLAVDSVAPLIRVRQFSGLAGGGQSLPVPQALGVRQRRRAAFKWILDAVDKKPSKGSGRKQFPYRVAEEVVAVAEGRSQVWMKRQEVHKLGMASRANLAHPGLRKK